MIFSVLAVRWRRKWQRRPLLLMLATYLGSAALVGLPLALYFGKHPDMLWKRAGQISVFDAPQPALQIIENIWTTLIMFWFHADNNWRHNYAGDPQLYWPVAILFTAGIVVAIRNLIGPSGERKIPPPNGL